MKKYTFGFYPNNHLATISIIATNRKEAEKLVRTMIPDVYFDDGLFIVDEEDYC